MISVTPVILSHHKRSDGTYPVKIRISFGRKSKYLSTSIIAQPEDVCRSRTSKTEMKAKSPALKSRMSILSMKISDIVSGMPMGGMEFHNIEEVVEYIREGIEIHNGFRLNFFDYAPEVYSGLSENSQKNYITALNVLAQFVGSRNLDINRINVSFMNGFEDFLRNRPRIIKVSRHNKTIVTNKGQNGRAVSAYCFIIKRIYKCAQKKYNEPDTGIMRIPNPTFDYYKVPNPPHAKRRNIPKETIQMMIDSHRSLVGMERFAIDAFLMSFLLMGMNAKDMYLCLAPENGVVAYNRSKTRGRRFDEALMKIRIEPEMKTIMNVYADPCGEFMLDFYRRYKLQALNSVLRQGLLKWEERMNVKHFTFYSARHSWATIARSKEVNVDKYLVNEGLVHIDPTMKTTDIYAQIDWETLWDANKRVISSLDWSKA